VLNLPLTVRLFTLVADRKRRGYVCVTGVHGIMKPSKMNPFGKYSIALT